MKKINSKDMYFKVLERELLKFFTVKDSLEILDDYMSFYIEKEEQGLSETEILLQMENPCNVVKSLAEDGLERNNYLSTFLFRHNTRLIISGMWLLASAIFVWLLEFIYVTSDTGTILIIIQVVGFWLIFGLRKLVFSGADHKKGTNRLNLLYFLVMVAVTYGCLVLMYLFCIGPEKVPLVNKMTPSDIGPFFHYIIMVALGINMIGIYYIYYKISRITSHVLVTVIGLPSTLVLISLHARMGSVGSLDAFAYFVGNQMIMYTTVLFCVVGLFVIFNKKLLKEMIQ